MKKFLLALSFLVTGSANATLLFTDISYTEDSVTFTVDGDMTGYAPPPPDYLGFFSLIYGGDMWASGYSGFEPNTWSRAVFDNETFSLDGNTGTSGNSYSWSSYSGSLSDAVVNSATVTLTMQNPRLNVDAEAPIISFIWGNGQPGSFKVMETVDLRTVSVPEPASIALFGLGLLALGLRRSRQSG